MPELLVLVSFGKPAPQASDFRPAEHLPCPAVVLGISLQYTARSVARRRHSPSIDSQDQNHLLRLAASSDLRPWECPSRPPRRSVRNQFEERCSNSWCGDPSVHEQLIIQGKANERFHPCLVLCRQFLALIRILCLSSEPSLVYTGRHVASDSSFFLWCSPGPSRLGLLRSSRIGGLELLLITFCTSSLRNQGRQITL